MRMAIDPNEALRLAEHWDRTAKAHDIEAFGTILADDFEMTYNFDPAPRSREQLLRSLAEVYSMLTDHEHVDGRITPTVEGFVIEATLRGSMGGTRIEAPFCLVARVRDGKVFRSREYFDTAQLPKRVGPPGEAMVEGANKRRHRRLR